MISVYNSYNNISFCSIQLNWLSSNTCIALGIISTTGFQVSLLSMTTLGLLRVSGDIKNYRPISLLATFSKVFEKLMHNRVINFLDTYNILCENQYGFRPGRSCEHALLNAKDRILNSMSKKQVTLLLLIDFSKAFDLVDHSILLNKLEHYGIRGIALNWFKSYLKNRNQFVSIGTSESSAKQIIYGVPQGSILGPLLFIIYINDLPQISEIAKFIMYADDANIFLTGENINEVYDKLKILSDVLVKWVDNNGLALNL